MGNSVLDISGLNPRQREAVEATEGRVRIVAGAGSGKTRVLATRYAFLVEDIGVDPANILCMTFTNKAAQEMKTRIGSLLSDTARVNDMVCTIHGFCVKLLRREIHRIGFPKNFNIVDEEDAKTFARQVMDSLGIDRKTLTAKQFLTHVRHKKRPRTRSIYPHAHAGRNRQPDTGISGKTPRIHSLPARSNEISRT